MAVQQMILKKKKKKSVSRVPQPEGNELTKR